MLNKIDDKRRSGQANANSAVLSRHIGQIDAAAAGRKAVASHAVRRDKEFLHDVFCVARTLGFNAEVLQGGIAGNDFEEDQAAAFDPKTLFYRYRVHGLGVLQTDEFPIANPNVGARAADFQNLRPNPECQTGGAQHGKRQETASTGRPDVQRSCFR